jgi:hypothetical protein
MNHATKVAVSLLPNSSRLGWVNALPDIGEIFRQIVKKSSLPGKHRLLIDCCLYSTLRFLHNTVFPIIKGIDIRDLHPSPAASNVINDLCNALIKIRKKPIEPLHRKRISMAFE